MAKPRTANSMYYYLPATAVRGTLSITTFASWGVWTAITTAGVGTHRAALPVIAAVTIVTTVAIGSTIIVAAAITTIGRLLPHRRHQSGPSARNTLN